MTRTDRTDPSRRFRRARVALAASGAAALLTLAAPLGASAHVRVIPDSTSSGGFAQLTFRVPTESDTASTTKIVVKLPQRTPLTFVSVKPLPGWTATVQEAALPQPVTVEGTKITKAASSVTWTASAGSAIRPGQYQDFSVSAGPLPAPGKLTFPTAQTYSDGRTVNWSQPTVEGQEEPESPAPSFVVTAKAATGEGGDAAPAGSAGAAGSSGGTGQAGEGSGRAVAAAASTTGGTAGASDTLARGLSGAALVVALLGVGAGGVALGRISRR